jgi:hypothetical protein
MNRPLLGAVLVLLGSAALGPAHDGGFGHSRRTLYLTTEGDTLVLEYRIQLNRDDALTEMTLMDADGDGTVSPEEKDRYLNDRAKKLAENLEVKTAAGDAVPLKFDRVRLDQGLTQTYRYTLTTSAAEVLLEDRNFGHKPGLVLVRNGDGVTVELAKQTDLTHADRVKLRVRRKESK